jgi:ribonucleoside-diphosphate reductase alpha chain
LAAERRILNGKFREGLQIKQSIACYSHSGFGENKILSCADAVARAIQSHMYANGNGPPTEKRAFFKGACPDCGGIVEHKGGCAVCHSCGYSECA